MTVCALDAGISGGALGAALPAWQALLLHRFLPSCGGLLVYITLICFDLALIIQHLLHKDTFMGWFCVLMMILPALASLVFTLASPPPGLRTEDSTLAVTIERQDVCWVLQQIGGFLVFPFTAIGRYWQQIFWSMEAVCAAYVEDAGRAGAALQRVRAPSPVELYLFLQAFLHAAPHALLNTLDMLSYREQPSFDKVSVQSVSIVVSMMRMASTATLYRRFEREKLNGKHYPWAIDTENLLADEEKPITQSNVSDMAETVSVIDNVQHRECAPLTLTNNLDCSHKKQMDKSYSFIDNLNRRLSVSSSGSEEYLQPVKAEKIHREDSYEEAVRRVSIIDRVAPRRNPSVYRIESVELPLPPSTPAPRPMSISAWAEKLIENAETIPEKISAPQRRRYVPEIVAVSAVLSADTTDNIPIPIATPRSYMRGLEPEDAVSAMVHYLSWYLFFIARVLSIATFLHFHPVIGIIVLMCHYQLMLLLLIVPQASTVRRGFYVFLAFVYVFCLLEFKIRFRHVRAWHVFWLVLCTVETVVFAGLWGTLGGEDIHWWWQRYVLSVIFGSLLMSYMCMLVYFVILKPKETIVYIGQKTQTKTDP